MRGCRWWRRTWTASSKNRSHCKARKQWRFWKNIIRIERIKGSRVEDKNKSDVIWAVIVSFVCSLVVMMSYVCDVWLLFQRVMCRLFFDVLSYIEGTEKMSMPCLQKNKSLYTIKKSCSIKSWVGARVTVVVVSSEIVLSVWVSYSVRVHSHLMSLLWWTGSFKQTPNVQYTRQYNWTFMTTMQESFHAGVKTVNAVREVHFRFSLSLLTSWGYSECC